MTRDEQARAHAAAVLASLQPASVLKPAPEQPSMSAESAKAIMADELKDAPPIDHDAFDPPMDQLNWHKVPDFPPPLPPSPTRWQRLAAWFNTPLLK